MDDYLHIPETEWIEPIHTQLNLQQEAKMVNVNEYVKPAGSYLNGKDVLASPGAIFVITTEGEMEKSEKFGNEKLTLEGEYNKVAKKLSLSKTNARTISEKLGGDTKAWIGHQLVLETYKTKTTDGKMTDAINIKEVK